MVLAICLHPVTQFLQGPLHNLLGLHQVNKKQFKSLFLQKGPEPPFSTSKLRTMCSPSLLLYFHFTLPRHLLCFIPSCGQRSYSRPVREASQTSYVRVGLFGISSSPNQRLLRLCSINLHLRPLCAEPNPTR